MANIGVNSRQQAAAKIKAISVKAWRNQRHAGDAGGSRRKHRHFAVKEKLISRDAASGAATRRQQ